MLACPFREGLSHWPLVFLGPGWSHPFFSLPYNDPTGRKGPCLQSAWSSPNLLLLGGRACLQEGDGDHRLPDQPSPLLVAHSRRDAPVPVTSFPSPLLPVAQGPIWGGCAHLPSPDSQPTPNALRTPALLSAASLSGLFAPWSLTVLYSPHPGEDRVLPPITLYSSLCGLPSRSGPAPVLLAHSIARPQQGHPCLLVRRVPNSK